MIRRLHDDHRTASARRGAGLGRSRRGPGPDAAREAAYRENNLGVALLEQYNHKEAAEAFARALEADPDFDLAQVNHALALFYIPDLAAAKDGGDRGPGQAAGLPAPPLPAGPHRPPGGPAGGRGGPPAPGPRRRPRGLRRQPGARPAPRGRDALRRGPARPRDRGRRRPGQRLRRLQPRHGPRSRRAARGGHGGHEALPGPSGQSRAHQLRQDLPGAGTLRGGPGLDRAPRTSWWTRRPRR